MSEQKSIWLLKERYRPKLLGTKIWESPHQKINGRILERSILLHTICHWNINMCYFHRVR